MGELWEGKNKERTVDVHCGMNLGANISARRGDVHDTTDRTISVSDDREREEAALTSRRPLERTTGMTRVQSYRFRPNSATDWRWETLALNACSSHHHHHHHHHHSPAEPHCILQLQRSALEGEISNCHVNFGMVT